MGEMAGVTWAWWSVSARPGCWARLLLQGARQAGPCRRLRARPQASHLLFHGVHRASEVSLPDPVGPHWSAQPCVAGNQSPPFTEEAEGVKPLTHGHKMSENHSAAGTGRSGGSARAPLRVPMALQPTTQLDLQATVSLLSKGA